jgi:hypothetical protein
MTTREEAAQIIYKVILNNSGLLHSSKGYGFDDFTHDLRNELLNELFPKPESERLKNLRKLLAMHAQFVSGPLTELNIALIKDAIADEVEKP